MAVDPLKIHLKNILPKIEVLPSQSTGAGVLLEFSVAHEMMHNLGEGKIKYNIHIDILDANKIPVADFCYDFFFEIDDIEENYQIIDGRPFFDGQFVATLLGIVYSTTRGILLSKFENSVLRGHLLPVINVFDLIK